MADTIKVKRGNKSAMGTLGDGELAIAKDEKRMYVGIGGTNTPMGAAVDKGLSTASENPVANCEIASIISALAGAVRESIYNPLIYPWEIDNLTLHIEDYLVEGGMFYIPATGLAYDGMRNNDNQNIGFVTMTSKGNGSNKYGTGGVQANEGAVIYITKEYNGELVGLILWKGRTNIWTQNKG